jgi:hypothetical protein
MVPAGLATVTIPVNGSITSEADQSTHGRRVLAGGVCGAMPAEQGSIGDATGHVGRRVYQA